jgi:hypothetical protein
MALASPTAIQAIYHIHHWQSDISENWFLNAQGREMIWVNFAISEQKANLKNHFCVLKKSKSFECIFTIVKFLKFS